MLYVIILDNIQIFYKDWGKGQLIVFYYGWLFSVDDWDSQLQFFLLQGYCVIVYDWCGYGCFLQICDGYEMDIYVVDVNVLVEYLDLCDVVYVGYFIGGGEVVYYVVQVKFGCVVKVVLIGVVLLVMIKSVINLGGMFREVFDGFCVQLVVGCVVFYCEVLIFFYGFNCDGILLVQGIIDNWWCQGMMGVINVYYDCIKVFLEIDFIEDLKKIDVLVLVMYGDDDQIVLIVDLVELVIKLFKYGMLKVYKGYLYGMCIIYVDVINLDLLVFICG